MANNDRSNLGSQKQIMEVHMAENQRDIIARRKTAARKALAHATSAQSYQEAFETMKGLGYDDTTSTIIVNSLQKKYAGMLDAEIERPQGAMRELANEYDIVDAKEKEEKPKFGKEPVEDEVEFEGDLKPGQFGEDDGTEFEEDEDFGEDSNEEVKVVELGKGTKELEIHTPSDEVLRLIIDSLDTLDEGGDDLDELGGNEGFGDEDLEDEDDDAEGFGDVSPNPALAEEDEMEEPESNNKGVPGMENREKALEARSRARRQLVAQVADKPEDINLGDDTSRSGDGRKGNSVKSFQMQDAVNVAGPGEKGKGMRLQGDGGNSLKNDPNMLYFDIPTNEDNTFNPAARGTMKLDGEYGDLVKQRVEFAKSEVPTQGGEDMDEFEAPTQLDYTTTRKPTVAVASKKTAQHDSLDLGVDLGLGDEDLDLGKDKFDGLDEGLGEDGLGDKGLMDEACYASVKQAKRKLTASKGPDNLTWAQRLLKENYNEKVVQQKLASKHCDAYTHNNDTVELVNCDDCGARLVLSARALQEGYCPVCETVDDEAKKMVAASINTQDWGNDFAADNRGDDTNGDGGFRTKDKIGKTPKDSSAEDMDLDAGEFEKTAQIEALERALAAEKLRSARLQASTKTAVRMAERGLIAEAEIEERINDFMGSDMTVPALQAFEKTAIKIASNNQQTRVASVSAKQTRQASTGLTSIPAIAEDRSPVDIRDALRGVFSVPSATAFDEETGRRRQF